MSYDDFIAGKLHLGGQWGFDPIWIPEAAFPFQEHLIAWALRKGRAALFADCGLGKTLMQLAWAENVCRKTGGRVLILTPLAVAGQTIREAAKFGIAAGGIGDGEPLIVANYERLHHLQADDFAGVVCDESSILKSFDGAIKTAVTEFMRLRPYRLLCTATAAPNDYTELGTSSEALGELGLHDMLNRFFVNDAGNSSTRGGGSARWHGHAPKWRFKGHAPVPFWRWVCSWARACRRPSDLGFEDAGFQLPQLIEQEHVVEAKTLAPGQLFAMPAQGMREEREERQRTITERCERVADLVNHREPAVVWCHLNPEGDLLERIIPGAVQVKGSMPAEEKERAYEAFASGAVRVLITKPKIGAWGLNWQHCAHVVTFASHSWEQYYQSVRRCWRFGQQRDVVVDLVATEGEAGLRENLRRKAEAADRMFSALVENMTASARIVPRVETQEARMPTWL